MVSLEEVEEYGERITIEIPCGTVDVLIWPTYVGSLRCTVDPQRWDLHGQISTVRVLQS